MAKVAIVTDSTSTIPAAMTRGLPIHTIPLQVIWGDETFRDGVDIQPTQFYERLKTAKVMPSTSQPSPAAFIKVYKELLDEGYDILSIHISSKISGTCDSAVQAQASFPGRNIVVFDSLSTSMPMGFQALAAARAAIQGASLQECHRLVEQARDNSGIFFAVSTLEFLHRGGRIGGASAFLGTVLNLKPILQLRDGRIEAVERVRTMAKAVDRLVELFEIELGKRTPIRIAALHANEHAAADLLLERVRAHFGISDVADAVIAEVSPVLGTHTGPGALALGFLAGM
jgi:DegV family protein with EDD domain